MRAYIAVMRMRFRTLITYRTAALAGIATQWVFGFFMISVLIAFYKNGDGGTGMTLAQVITYTWLGQAMLGLSPWSIDGEVGQTLRTGGIAYDLLRPMNLFNYWFARAIALRTAPTVLRAIPMFIITGLLLPKGIALTWPTLPALGGYIVSILGALCLSCSITAFMQSTLFLTTAGEGIVRIFPNFVILLSGMVVPLPVFPDALQGILRALPFAGLVDIPARIFCGNIKAIEAFPLLLLQLAWSAAFYLLGIAITSFGIRRVETAGG